MNTHNKNTYEDVALICIAEIATLCAHELYPASAVLIGSFSLLLFIQRFVDEASTNMLPLRKTSLMVFLSWGGYFTWSKIVHFLELPWYARWWHTACHAILGLHTAINENENFHLKNKRAGGLLALCLGIGLVPINNPAWIGWYALQSLLHAGCVFALFFLRVQLKRNNYTASLFTFSFWILTGDYILVDLIALAVLLRTLQQFYETSVKEPEIDVEMPPEPPPIVRTSPKPPPPTPKALLIKGAHMAAEQKKKEAYENALQPPPQSLPPPTLPPFDFSKFVKVHDGRI